MSPLPRAILLDLDNTILEYSGLAADCWRSACEEFAPQIENVAAETLFEAIDRARVWFWSGPERHRSGRLNLVNARREIVTLAFRELNLDAPDVTNRIADRFTVRREELVRPFPGAVETLERLRASGVRLALLTNGSSEMQRGKLRRFHLERFFDTIRIEGEFGVGKPDERIYRHALAALDAMPQEAWMVGDDLEWEVAAPQRLGIFTVWCDYLGAGLPESSPVRPNRIIRTLAELI
jgi:putative hydrolase of the HAD superfamily